MKGETRRLEILTILGNTPAMSVRGLAKTIGVSEMTIRRDLDELSSKDYITMIQGVAILNNNNDGTSIIKDYSLGAERQLMAKEKSRIGKLAASLIEPNDTILIDTGTTTEQILNHIPGSCPLTFITYNLNTLLAIKDREQTDIYCGGGFLHRNTQMFESQESCDLISRLCITKFFVSAAGISSKGAISCVEQHELPTKQAGIKNSLVRILMADSTKFGKIRPCMFSKIENMDIIVTDSGIGSSWLDFFKSCGIKYMLA